MRNKARLIYNSILHRQLCIAAACQASLLPAPVGHAVDRPPHTERERDTQTDGETERERDTHTHTERERERETRAPRLEDGVRFCAYGRDEFGGQIVRSVVAGGGDVAPLG